MTAETLRQALAYARSGWPVFPCQPGAKIPATAHGFRDATTDPVQITSRFGRGFGWNLAIATGAPGPDVLDIDQHGPAGNGYPAFARLQQAGLVTGAAAYVRTPAGGMHAYFAGSDQHNGHLARHHVDFRSHGGYIVGAASHVDGRPYQVIKTPAATAAWTGTRPPGCWNPKDSQHRRNSTRPPLRTLARSSWNRTRRRSLPGPCGLPTSGRELEQ